MQQDWSRHWHKQMPNRKRNSVRGIQQGFLQEMGVSGGGLDLGIPKKLLHFVKSSP
jgi:hypothetical protein